MTDMDNAQLEGEPMDVLHNPERSVPKFVSSINFNGTNEGGVVMTLFGESPGISKKILIETIYLEKKHILEVIDVLEKVTNRQHD